MYGELGTIIAVAADLFVLVLRNHVLLLYAHRVLSRTDDTLQIFLDPYAELTSPQTLLCFCTKSLRM